MVAPRQTTHPCLPARHVSQSEPRVQPIVTLTAPVGSAYIRAFLVCLGVHLCLSRTQRSRPSHETHPVSFSRAVLLNRPTTLRTNSSKIPTDGPTATWSSPGALCDDRTRLLRFSSHSLSWLPISCPAGIAPRFLGRPTCKLVTVPTELHRPVVDTVFQVHLKTMQHKAESSTTAWQQSYCANPSAAHTWTKRRR